MKMRDLMNIAALLEGDVIPMANAANDGGEPDEPDYDWMDPSGPHYHERRRIEKTKEEQSRRMPRRARGGVYDEHGYLLGWYDDQGNVTWVDGNDCGTDLWEEGREAGLTGISFLANPVREMGSPQYHQWQDGCKVGTLQRKARGL